MQKNFHFSFSILLSLLGIMCSLNCVFSQEEARLFAKDASLFKVASDYKFTEGPASDRMGNVYFTDQPNDRIIKWNVVDEKVTVYMQNSGRSNGLFVDDLGNLIACADLKNQLWQIDQNQNVSILVHDFEGKKLNGPNDLWIDRKGGIYFTDPFYKRPYWSRAEKEIESENVYYLSPDKKNLQIVAQGFVRPNGIVGSKNGRKLFVADIGDQKTYSFKVHKDGSLSDRKLFVEMGSDGMTLDHQGNLYITGKGVTIFNKKGVKIGHIDVPENWTANVCFGGEQQHKLFITAMGSLYTMDMQVKGIRW